MSKRQTSWPPPTDDNTLTLEKLQAAVRQFQALTRAHDVARKIEAAKSVEIRLTEHAIRGEIMVLDAGSLTLFGEVPGDEGLLLVGHPDNEGIVRDFVAVARGDL